MRLSFCVDLLEFRSVLAVILNSLLCVCVSLNFGKVFIRTVI